MYYASAESLLIPHVASSATDFKHTVIWDWLHLTEARPVVGARFTLNFRRESVNYSVEKATLASMCISHSDLKHNYCNKNECKRVVSHVDWFVRANYMNWVMPFALITFLLSCVREFLSHLIKKLLGEIL